MTYLIKKENICTRDVIMCHLYRQQWHYYTSSQIEIFLVWCLMICVQCLKGSCQTTTSCLGRLTLQKKLMRSLGLKFVKMHACPNNCMLLYKETEGSTMCTSCGLGRYAHDVGGSTFKKVPRKVLQYLPIILRLQQLFMPWETVKYMSSPLGTMTHPSHGEAQRYFDDTFSNCSSDLQNTKLGLCADGFSLFGFSVKFYSIWLVILTVYIQYLTLVMYDTSFLVPNLVHS